MAKFLEGSDAEHRYRLAVSSIVSPRKNAASLQNSRRFFLSIDFFIPSLVHRRMGFQDFLPTRAGYIVVVDDAAGLKVGVDGHGTDILKAPLLQIFAQPVRQAVADGNFPLIVTLVEDDFSVTKAPDVIGKAAELVPHFLTALSIADDGPNLSRRADHALGVHNAFYIVVIVGRDFIVVKVIEALPNDLALSKYNEPTEAALQVFQGQMLEHLPIVVNGNAPFVIMIHRIERIRTGPFTISHLSLPFHRRKGWPPFAVPIETEA